MPKTRCTKELNNTKVTNKLSLEAIIDIRSNPPEVFSVVPSVLWKRYSENMQQIYRKIPIRIVISIKLFSNVVEVALRHGCSPVNLLPIFRTPFSKNTSGGLLLWYATWEWNAQAFGSRILEVLTKHLIALKQN